MQPVPVPPISPPSSAPDGTSVSRATPVAWPWWALAGAAVVLPRLAVFGLNENVYGDSVIRTELGMRWAAAPHWISSWKDGPYQFGPLHIYLSGLAYQLWPAREHAARLVSLLVGLGSAFPLFFLTRRLFDTRAALWAVAGLGLWGMHWNLSATAASEALGMFTLLLAVAALARAFDAENPLPSLLGAAVALQGSCATRYDSWLSLPVFALLVWQRLGFKRAFLFGVFCTPFPLFWLIGNHLYAGDALAPVKDIAEFHRNWMPDGLARYGELNTRLLGLVFWPGAALVTLSPLLAAEGFAGMAAAGRARRDVRWVLWIALVPTAYFAFRSAVLLDFVPLARFTVNQVVLVLPFAALGFDAVTRELRPLWRRVAFGLTWSCAAVLPVWLAVFTYDASGKFEDALRPVSPITTNPRPVQVAVDAVRDLARAGDTLLIDLDASYFDLQLAFYAGLPDEQVLRYRYKPHRYAPPPAEVRWVVLSHSGGLTASEGFTREGDGAIRWGDQRFVKARALEAPFEGLYERVR